MSALLRSRYAAIPAILAVCVLFYWKLALSTEYVWFDHPDMCYIEVPRLQFQASEFHKGRFPLWDPSLWMGQPLIGQTQPGPLYPLNIAFLLAPLRNGYLDFQILNWYFVLLHAIAALGAYALCRELHRSKAASMLAAVAFAFGGFVGTVAWLDVLNGAIWTPLITLFFLRAIRGLAPMRNAALCGLLLGVAWLSGHHEVPLMVSYALAAGWACAIRRQRLRALAPAVVTFVIAGMIAAVQLWPTAEFAQLSRRWVGLENSYGWKDALPYVSPTFYSMPLRAVPAIALDDTVSHADSMPFLGMVVFSLALIAIACSWRRPPVRWMTALTLAATVFALGAATPLHGLLFSYAPMLGKARIPVRAIHLINFGLVVLAAVGLDVIRRRTPKWLTMGLLATGIYVVALWVGKTDISEGILRGGIVALVFAAVLRSRRAVPVAAICLCIFELYPVSTRTFSSSAAKDGQKFVRTLTDNQDIVDFLRSEPAPRRLAVEGEDIPTNFGDWHGFDVMEGYVAGVTENLTEVPRHTREMQRVFAITHYVGRKSPRPDVVEAFTGASGIKVFRNPEALPRVWLVHDAQRVGGRAEIAPTLEGGVDPAGRALMTTAVPKLETCGEGSAEVLSMAPNRVRARINTPCRGLAIFSETFYPGWIARVDGREAPILEVFGALRGVVVESGQHEVDMSYRPASVYRGALVSAAGLALALVLIVIPPRQRSAARAR